MKELITEVFVEQPLASPGSAKDHGCVQMMALHLTIYLYNPTKPLSSFVDLEELEGL